MRIKIVCSVSYLISFSCFFFFFYIYIYYKLHNVYLLIYFKSYFFFVFYVIVCYFITYVVVFSTLLIWYVFFILLDNIIWGFFLSPINLTTIELKLTFLKWFICDFCDINLDVLMWQQILKHFQTSNLWLICLKWLNCVYVTIRLGRFMS